jgi:prevent-host-death family protein
MPDQPTIQTMKISDVRNSFSRLVHQVYRKQSRVLVEKNGIPVAAIVSADDLDRLSRWEREREARFAVIDRMRAAFADVPPEEIEREAERTVAEARERIRQRTSEPAARSA